MDLWIRSQDKEILKQAYHIDIYEIGLIESGTQCWCIEESGTILGKYKSKERALEILDDIQNKIKALFYLKPNCSLSTSDTMAAKKYFEELNDIKFIITDTNFDVVPITTNAFVYEMPEK